METVIDIFRIVFSQGNWTKMVPGATRQLKTLIVHHGLHQASARGSGGHMSSLLWTKVVLLKYVTGEFNK